MTRCVRETKRRAIKTISIRSPSLCNSRNLKRHEEHSHFSYASFLEKLVDFSERTAL